jgi:hypothetical protein
MNKTTYVNAKKYKLDIKKQVIFSLTPDII